MATKEQRRRKRRSAPIAASADRSKKERDRFFGGAIGGTRGGSKSTRGYRSVGKDIRSKAAKAAGTGRSLGKATLRPTEVAEADALDRISDNLTEQNVRSPEPLPEAPVENITDSVMSPVVREAIAAGTGGFRSPEPLPEAPVENITNSVMSPSVRKAIEAGPGPERGVPLPWTGEPDSSYMAPPIADPEKKTERPLLSIEDLEGADGQKEAYDYPDSLSIEDLEGDEEMQRRFFKEVDLAKKKKSDPSKRAKRSWANMYNNLGLPDFYPRPRFSGGDVRRLMPEQIEGQRKLAGY